MPPQWEAPGIQAAAISSFERETKYVVQKLVRPNPNSFPPPTMSSPFPRVNFGTPDQKTVLKPPPCVANSASSENHAAQARHPVGNPSFPPKNLTLSRSDLSLVSSRCTISHAPLFPSPPNSTSDSFPLDFITLFCFTVVAVVPEVFSRHARVVQFSSLSDVHPKSGKR